MAASRVAGQAGLDAPGMIQLLSTWLTANWWISWISLTLLLVVLSNYAPEFAFYLALLVALGFALRTMV